MQNCSKKPSINSSSFLGKKLQLFILAIVHKNIKIVVKIEINDKAFHLSCAVVTISSP